MHANLFPKKKMQRVPYFDKISSRYNNSEELKFIFMRSAEWDMIIFAMNDREVSGEDGWTILEVAREHAIDLFLNERLAQLSRLAHAKAPDNYKMKIRRQSWILVDLRRPGKGVPTGLNAPHQTPEGLI
jgi:hypothetical protein